MLGVPPRILFASSEVVGYSKTGGLADVAGALPVALARRGLQVAVVTPLYRCARSTRYPLTPTDVTLTVPVGGRAVSGRLWRSELPRPGGTGVPVFLIEHADYFERDDPADGRGLYQFTAPGGTRHDYPDNCERFVFFNRAILELIRRGEFRPDVLHCNDWQTALAPVYLRTLPDGPGEHVRSLLTIHNIGFQGIFWHFDMDLAGLDWGLFEPGKLEYHGKLNLLKGGLVHADRISTVSPTYASEIQTPQMGCGLDGVLRERRRVLTGIVNGVDPEVWDPARDPHLAARYTRDTFASGKPVCKRALQGELGLGHDPDAPLLGMVARLTAQKGVELVLGVMPALLEAGAQLAVLGEGEPRYREGFLALRDRFPGRVGLRLGFDEGLAHRIEAGCDLFLMPSLYEPSGLNQLYSLAYGTPPVVRATGGLADTVCDTTPASLATGTATGFSFLPPTAAALHDAVGRALALYRNQPDLFRQVVRTGMGQDWSWERSAAEYERVYEQICQRS